MRLLNPVDFQEWDCGLNYIEGRILELHSPDGVHECWLRAADSAEANVWFNALHSALAALTLKALRLASALPDPQQLQHIGWLARRHCLQVRKAPEHFTGESMTPDKLLT
ncbi:beta-1-syntrophin-like protein [Lasius niger]|uniref:Beta-1-syntrophin-like protein n=1 Tax=Lasius niger TaxID=67767 RepID=A0A0J7K8R9_LASNI|nr:beta-1-syntrophin-like protein [Lasius niger]